jgi:hypothetical protein
MAVEAKQFRNGENPGRPWGGNVADHPFSQALFELAETHGFPSQRSFSIALNRSNATVANWFTGKKVPYPRQIAEIITTCQTSSQEAEQLIDLYNELRFQRRGRVQDTPDIIKAAFEAIKSQA